MTCAEFFWNLSPNTVKMGRGQTEFSPLLPPTPITKHSKIDLESGTVDQIQCRICLETDGRDFISPCKCKGTSKYVHRACLNHWRAVKEGFSFAHCTTCKAPYYLRADNISDRRWRTLKFRFFVTRDITFIFLAIQMVIALLAYLVYLIDGSPKFWLRRTLGFGSGLSFYYLCGLALTANCLLLLICGLLIAPGLKVVIVHPVNVVSWKEIMKLDCHYYLLWL